MPARRNAPLLIAVGVAVALVAAFAVPWSNLFGPERSVAAYCQIWQEEGAKLRSRQAAAQRQGADGDFLAPFTAAMGAPGDLAEFFDKLAKVAPDDIRPDIERYRDAWEEIADSYQRGGFTQMLLTQAAIAAQTKGVEQRIETWTSTHCTSNPQGATP